MQKRERTCVCCGKVESTFSQVDRCSDCKWIQQRTAAAVSEREKLESIGYTDIEGPVLQQTLHRSWIFTHTCGTRQTWRFGNILKQLSLRPDSVPCKTCGGKERISKAMAAFVEKYGRDFDIQKWVDYRQTVRKLTEATYKKYKADINPLNLKRGMRTFHLDHRIPIIQGFVSGLPPEVLAARENLQILPAFDNISKGRK
jgi:hypothetical protein